MDGSQFVIARNVIPRGTRFLQRDLSPEALQRPPAPLFDRAELAASRLDGYAEGRAVALAEAASSHAQAVATALGLIATRLADSQARAALVADEAAGELTQALVAAMHAVMPDLIERAALRETGAMLAAVLPGLSREPTIRVEVPCDIAVGIAAAVATMLPEHRDRISVTCADGLPAGDARISWASGHALRQPAQVWRTVMDLLEPALAQPRLKDDDNGE
jgi:hypothetical protein